MSVELLFQRCPIVRMFQNLAIEHECRRSSKPQTLHIFPRCLGHRLGLGIVIETLVQISNPVAALFHQVVKAKVVGDVPPRSRLIGQAPALDLPLRGFTGDWQPFALAQHDGAVIEREFLRIPAMGQHGRGQIDWIAQQVPDFQRVFSRSDMGQLQYGIAFAGKGCAMRAGVADIFGQLVRSVGIADQVAGAGVLDGD